jgi:hypothetical protein
MEVIMANTPNVPVRKSNINTILAVSGWGLIAIAVLLGAGFYLGTQYSAKQAAHDKQIIKAALVTPAPVAAAPAVK